MNEQACASTTESGFTETPRDAEGLGRRHFRSDLALMATGSETGRSEYVLS